MKKKLLEDMKEAMISKNEVKKNTIQMVRAAILQVEKDKQVELDDNQIIDIISKEVVLEPGSHFSGKREKMQFQILKKGEEKT